ncbi:MAG: hypothetical protein AMXMBFR64_50500 [Myxococcales bacterium]
MLGARDQVWHSATAGGVAGGPSALATWRDGASGARALCGPGERVPGSQEVRRVVAAGEVAFATSLPTARRRGVLLTGTVPGAWALPLPCQRLCPVLAVHASGLVGCSSYHYI